MLVAGQSANSGGAPIKLIKNLPFALYFYTSLFVLTIFHLYTVQSRLYALYASVGVMWFAAGWRFKEREGSGSNPGCRILHRLELIENRADKLHHRVAVGRIVQDQDYQRLAPSAVYAFGPGSHYACGDL